MAVDPNLLAKIAQELKLNDSLKVTASRGRFDADDYEPQVEGRVRAKYCREAKPVDTIMQVTRFVNPEWLVEIEADAVIAED